LQTRSQIQKPDYIERLSAKYNMKNARFASKAKVCRSYSYIPNSQLDMFPTKNPDQSFAYHGQQTPKE